MESAKEILQRHRAKDPTAPLHWITTKHAEDAMEEYLNQFKVEAGEMSDLASDILLPLAHKVDLSRVRNTYTILNVEEYYHPRDKWCSVLPNGIDVRTPALYRLTIPGTKGAERPADIMERVIQMCISAGAVQVQLKCKKGGKDCTADYGVNELQKDEPKSR